MAIASKIVTYEEWLAMPEVEDAIEEVVDGEISIMPPAKWHHAGVVESLADTLKPQLDRKLVRVVTTNFGLVIRLTPLTTRVPDLAVFITANIVEKDGYIHSPPELVVEVLSPANTRVERVRKIADSASLGVPEVWVFSPEAQTLEILHLVEGQLRTVGVVREGQIHPRLFPEAVVDIAAIWPA